MVSLNHVIVYVDQPLRSASFYQKLLGIEPVESSPTFALFVLESGVKLGFWSRHTVEPAIAQVGEMGELAFSVATDEEVGQLYLQWQQWGVEIIQHPSRLDFGYTFTACDADGVRLRVYALHLDAEPA